MNAKEFLLNSKDGYYASSKTCQLLEQYADHKTKELQKEVEMLKQERNNFKRRIIALEQILKVGGLPR